jgi:hypothetical protein
MDNPNDQCRRNFGLKGREREETALRSSYRRAEVVQERGETAHPDASDILAGLTKPCFLDQGES